MIFNHLTQFLNLNSEPKDTSTMKRIITFPFLFLFFLTHGPSGCMTPGGGHNHHYYAQAAEYQEDGSISSLREQIERLERENAQLRNSIYSLKEDASGPFQDQIEGLTRENQRLQKELEQALKKKA